VPEFVPLSTTSEYDMVNTVLAIQSNGEDSLTKHVPIVLI